MGKYIEATEHTFIDKNEVNPDEVWGDSQKVFEIVGLGSGKGFEIANVNLPKDWENSFDQLKSIDPKRVEKLFSMMCQNYGAYSLDKLVLDENYVLKEVAVKNEEAQSVARLYLPDNEFDWKKRSGVYVSENINDCQAPNIMNTLS
jgi:hypothetical protein